MATTIDELQVLITAQNKQFKQAMSEVHGGLDDVDNKSSKAGEALKTFSKVAVVAAAAAGAAFVAGFSKAIKATANLEQSLGGSEVVFGKYAKSLQDTARLAFKNMGTSTTQYLDTANKMGSLFQGAGYTVKDSLDMTQKAMQRSTDVATAMGIDTSMALESIAGAAKGNFTMMDNLGVAMNDTTLNAYALEKGIGKTTEQMTNAEKVGLAMQMFMDRTSKYAGNYAKENETLAGSFSTLKAAFGNFMAGVEGSGKDLANALKQVASVLSKKIPEIAHNLASNLSDMVSNLMTTVDWAAIYEKMIPSSAIRRSINEVFNLFKPVVIDLYNAIKNNLIPALSSAYNAVQPFIVAIGTALVGAIYLSLQAITAIITVTSGLISAITENTILFAVLVGVVGGATAAYVIYNTALKVVMATKALLIPLTSALTAIHTLQTAGIGTLRAAWIVLNATMLANPIGLIIAAIGILIGVIVALSTTTNNQTDEERALNDQRDRSIRLADDLKQSEDELKGAKDNVKDATLRQERALKTYNDMVAQHGRDALETREAARQLEKAEEDLKAANERTQTAVQNNTVAVQAQKTEMDKLSEKLKNFNGKTFTYYIQGVEHSIQKGSDGKNYATPTFSSGGFTGRGGKFDPAGIVHKGEYVLPKEFVDQSTGLPMFGKLNVPSFSVGGMVGSKSSHDLNNLEKTSSPSHLTVNVGAEKLIDMFIDGINNRSFMGNNTVINV